MQKLIITAAVTGSGPTRAQNPNLPLTPEEIAQEALRCWRSGAAVAHVHVRDPLTGTPTFEQHLFAEVVQLIRAESDLLINLTTSGYNLEGTDVGTRRLMPLELKPELCSLDVGSLNRPQGRVFTNPADWAEMAAGRMQAMQVKPEIEVFELGHVIQAADLVAKNLVAPPPYFQLCLGVAWGAPADIETLLAMKSYLPPGSQWSVLGIGRHQLPITTHALLLGGHVRVGFEDNLYLSKGVLAKSNAEFVERTVKLAGLLQREVASCAEARQMLGLDR